MKGKILVELQEYMGSDASIANAAWTSTYDKNKRDVRYDDIDKIKDLVPKLIKENHGTPIESVVFRFWIRMPIFVDRQHMTHRIASHNGLSGRYRTMPDDWYSLPEDVLNILSKINNGNFAQSFKNDYDEICLKANKQYKFQLDILKKSEKRKEITNFEFKRCREILRGQLPQAGMIERTTIMNLRSFANYIKQRLSKHAQPEIQEVARLMLEEVENKKICPIAIDTLKKIKWNL